MILKFITFDLENSTIEANWFSPVTDEDGVVVSYESSRKQNYSVEQKAEFLAEVEGGQAYATAMGW